MTVHAANQSRPVESFAQWGEEIYNRDIRPLVEADNKGRIVAIDIATGEYQIGENVLIASKTLRVRVPNAQIWVVRVGHRAVHRLSPRSRTEAR